MGCLIIEMSHWTCRGESVSEPPKGAYGFVYLITNKINNRKYIGRKYFKTSRKKPLTKKQKSAGRVRASRINAESNWKNYCGSSDLLLEDIDTHGKDNFIFEIIAYGYTKGQVNYLEETLHHKLDVIAKDNFYNTAVGSRKYANISLNEQFYSELDRINKLISD